MTHGGGKSKKGREDKTKTWSDVVKGLTKVDELETTNSDKSGNGLETADSDEPNNLKAKRTKRQPKRRQHRDSKGAEKGLTSRQDGQKGQDAQNWRGQ